MPHLPARFDQNGLLPPWDYELTMSELQSPMLVKGPSRRSPHWDVGWRRQLVERLEIMVRQLWQVGIDRIFIDGSFVEEKDHPNDIDGYFECDLKDLTSGRLENQLNLLDPKKAWTWNPASRRPDRNSTKNQLPMWHFYRVELYPHFGQPSGLRDKFGNELMFPSAFRQSRQANRTKGIVRIIKKKA